MSSIPMELRGKATTDVATAGRILGISRNSAYAAAAAGTLPVIRMNGRILVPVAPLLRMLGIEQDASTTTEAA